MTFLMLSRCKCVDVGVQMKSVRARGHEPQALGFVSALLHLLSQNHNYFIRQTDKVQKTSTCANHRQDI